MRTLDKYRSTVKRHLIPALGKVRLSALSKIQVQQACNRLGEGEKPLSAKSIHDTHGILHRALQQAVELELIAKNPSDSCRLPRKEKKEIRMLTAKDTYLKADEAVKHGLVDKIADGTKLNELIGGVAI